MDIPKIERKETSVVWSMNYPQTQEITLLYDERKELIGFVNGHDKEKGELAYIYCPVPKIYSDNQIKKISEFMRNVG